MRFLLLIFFGLAFYGCSLDKVVEVKLPAYERKLVAECYLEYDKRVEVFLMESQSYFDTLELSLINDAKVVIRGAGRDDSLENKTELDFEYKKFHNFSGFLENGMDTLASYSLIITDPKGRKLTGKTTFLPKPNVDTIITRYDLDRDSAAGFLIWIQDFKDQKNYYRLIINDSSLTKPASANFTFTDIVGDGKRIPIGTGYRYKKGTTVFIRVFHIEKQYYDYLESLDDANRSNGNPFAQPATVKSAMEGGYGIFTTLNYRQYEIKL